MLNRKQLDRYDEEALGIIVPNVADKERNRVGKRTPDAVNVGVEGALGRGEELGKALPQNVYADGKKIANEPK